MGASKDSLRTLFAAGIVASALAAVAAFPDGGAQEFRTILILLKGVLFLSAALAFAFLLSRAAALKYEYPGTVGEFKLGKKFESICYDLSIDIYGIALAYAAVYVISIPVKKWSGLGDTAAFLVTAGGIVILAAFPLALLHIFRRKKPNAFS